MKYKITKWCKSVTDDNKDHTVCAKPKDLPYKFRILDDDGNIYGYGYADEWDTEEAFEPMDRYQGDYGVTEIQYKNPETGIYETL